MNPAEQLISLAFPSFQKPKKKVDWMQEPYYSSGVAAESHPIASVLGPLKGFNVLRKWMLGQAVKPKPTTAPLALTDQSIDYPRLMAPPDRPRLTNTYTASDHVRRMLERLPGTRADTEYYDSRYDDIELYGYADEEGPSHLPVSPRTAPGGVPTDLTRQNNYWLETERRDAHADRAWRARNPYHRDYDDQSEIEEHGIIGSFPQVQGGPHTFYSRPQEGTLVNRIYAMDEDGENPYSYEQDQIVMGPRGSETIDRPTQVGFTPEYGIPKGYYSALSKILAGDTLNKAEKESATREIKYRQMAYDKKRVGDGHTYREQAPVPSLTDHAALRAWMEKHPLEFTTRTGHDKLTPRSDSVSTLHFGGGNEQGAVHFTTPEGLDAQAFVSYNEDGGTFNVLEAQNEMRGEGNPYMHQAIPKLAQQTVLDWADSGLSTITIPTGEAIFDKYYSTIGKGLWGDEKNLLKIKDAKEFAEKAFTFYNQPLIQKEVEKDVLKHIELLATPESFETAPGLNDVHFDLKQRFGKEYVEAISDLALGTRRFGEAEANLQGAIDILTLRRADELKGLRSNYQGKVRHYNEYTKQVKKALKQHGAEFSEGGLRDLGADKDDSVILELTNPEETIRRTKKDGFTMAMNILKGIADRQVA